MNVWDLLTPEQQRQLGAPLVGGFVACCLWGAAFASTALYYQRFPKDRAGFKILVGSAACIDFLHTAFLIAGFYYRYVDKFGDALASLDLDWRMAALLPLLSIITLIVQGFFAWRLWILLNRALILPSLIALSSIFTLAFAGVYTQRNRNSETFIKNSLDRPDGYFMAAVSLPAASDALIVCSMVWIAWKNRSTFSHTRHVFFRWVELAFETNALTFTLCLATVIAYGLKAPYYGAPFSFLCVKMYDLTLTIALHARAELQAEAPTSQRSGPTSGHYRSNPSSDRSTIKRVPAPMHLVFIGASSEPKSDHQHFEKGDERV